MEALYAWIRSIVFYLIFMTLVTSLLPGRKYDRYFKLFTGMVLILLVISPLTGSLRLDERLARWFETFSFQSEAGELRGQMEEIERKRLEAVVEAYEDAVSEGVEQRLEEEGCREVVAQVTINRDQESKRFGAIDRIEIRMEAGGSTRAQERSALEEGEAGDGGRPREGGVSEEGGESAGLENGRDAGGKPAREIESSPEIKIRLPEISLSGQGKSGPEKPGPGPSGQEENRESDGKGDLSGEESGEGFGAGPLSSQASAPGAAGNREAERIRKEIAEFYGLEESRIEIQFKDGEAGP